MKDLIGSYERLRRFYQMYIESAFPFKDESLQAERREMLDNGVLLAQEPLVEPAPQYPSSGMTLEQVALELGEGYQGLAELAKPIMGDFELYEHQYSSLVAALRDKKDIVVTTGTGSGKTECFMLPLLAEIAKDSCSWPPSPKPDAGRRWWRTQPYRWQAQWGHTGRAGHGLHAVRAMILYPLNALVEDQLRRLRIALDSPSTHSWLDINRGENRVLFGRYTGSTPVSGPSPELDGTNGSISRLAKYMKIAEAEDAKVAVAAAADKQLRYHFQNLEGGEMWSRWDMQLTPPDILITNYSMLNIMLMRDAEAVMFERTREWLARDPSNIFSFVVDELHSYRGTAGTEVAYILRLFLDRIGLSPDSPQLRIMATSASFDDGSSSFLEEFFGRRKDAFQIINGIQRPLAMDGTKEISKYAGIFSAFARDLQPDPVASMQPPDDGSMEKAARKFLDQFDVDAAAYTCNGLAEAMDRVMGSIGAIDALRRACVGLDGISRATRLSAIEAALFPNLGNGGGRVASEAMRGILLALACGKQPNGVASLPMRSHLFFHNLQNIWACSNPGCSQSKPPEGGGIRTIGALHGYHRVSCSCGGKVLDLLVCSVCGEVFLGGYRTDGGERGMEFLTSDMPGIEKMPDAVDTYQNHAEYAVFFPKVDVPVGENGADGRRYTWRKSQCSWQEASLEVYTGLLCRPRSQEGRIVNGWVYAISDADRQALPPICPSCGADQRRASSFPTPLRPHRTGFQRTSQVLAASLIREINAGKGTRKGKLVLFSDSRQDAAKLSAGMELDHYRDMVRAAVVHSHQAFVENLCTVVAYFARKYGIEGLQAFIGQSNPTFPIIPLYDQDDVARSKVREFREPHKEYYQAIRDISLGELDEVDQGVVNEIQWLLSQYPHVVPFKAIRNDVFMRLARIGICPGGPRATYVRYREGNSWHDWWECFDWSSPGKVLAQSTPAQREHITRLEESLMREIVLSVFSNAVRTFESLGLGYATYRPVGSPDKTVVECTNAIIRNMCLKRNFMYWPNFAQADGEAELWKRHLRYCDVSGVEPNLIVAELRSGKFGIRGEHSDIGIDPNKLWLYLPGQHAKEGYRCTKCGAFYLGQAGGYCIECLDAPLEMSEVDASLDYYRFLSGGGGGMFRLHCEELTGQTDVSDKGDRQRWFQGVFLDGEIKEAREVDLLSVTTTMEAGVDIGSLLAVEMANMPPRRFNYQQRVGRAGRRGDPLSIALTICRGRSHDDFYYQRPEKITGDPSPPPYLDTAREEIIKRVIAKECLRRAFASLPDVIRTQMEGLDGGKLGQESVHGAFGPVAGWSLSRVHISNFLKGMHDGEISDLASCCATGTAWYGDPDFLVWVNEFVREGLVQVIDEKVARAAYGSKPMAELLASQGILPMFGFPTNTRLMFTRVPTRGFPWPPEHGTIDRQLEMAISQFAPGSETVKDKMVHKSMGVVDLLPGEERVMVRNGFKPPLDEGNVKLGLCSSCFAVIPMQGATVSIPACGDPVMEVCEVCGEETLRLVDAREPTGFFSDGHPKEFEGVFEYVPSASRPKVYMDQAELLPVSGTNAKIIGKQCRLAAVNDNAGQGGFDFVEYQLERATGSGAYKVKGDGDDGRPSYRVALLSQKTTDVFLFDMQVWPLGVFADPMTVEGRAAWYSYSFMLRTAVSSMLDIDPQELSAGFRTVRRNGRASGQGFLSDTLDNGAGYCRWLEKDGNFMEAISLCAPETGGSIASKWLEGSHADGCDTSCNRCLRDYYNLPYHGLLDWRIALDMFRIAIQPDAVVDLYSPWQGVENPWKQVFFGDNPLAVKVLQEFGFEHDQSGNGLPIFVSHARRKILVAAHPLWELNANQQYLSAKEDAISKHNISNVGPVNPFLLLRRPVDLL
ncbi:MAG: DEAD/DEAH box helicase [Chlorobiaceae bacterium]|nr:DEAD/DEAH box helicase [Chlorobiaceae bacterium]